MRGKRFLTALGMLILAVSACLAGCAKQDDGALRSEQWTQSFANVTYDGSAHTPKVVIEGLTEGMDFNVTYADNVDAGTATVKVVGIGAYSGTLSRQFTIQKAVPTVLSPPSASGISHGLPLSASILTGGEADIAGSFAWKLPDTLPERGEGDYEVVFVPEDQRNYETVPAGTVALTVTKAIPSVAEKPTAGALSYGQKLSESALSGGVFRWGDVEVEGSCAWKEPDSVPDVVNDGYEAVFTPSDSDRFASVTLSVRVPVSKRLPGILTPPAASGLTYGQTLADSALTGGAADVEGSFFWEDESVLPTVRNQGYRVKFVPSDEGNYDTVYDTVPVAVQKLRVTVTAGETFFEYDGAAKSAEISVEPEIEFSVFYEGAGYPKSEDPPSLAGSYTVTVEANENYELSQSSFSMKITSYERLTGARKLFAKTDGTPLSPVFDLTALKGGELLAVRVGERVAGAADYARTGDSLYFEPSFLRELACGTYEAAFETAQATFLASLTVADVVIHADNYTRYLTNTGDKTLATADAAALRRHYVLDTDVDFSELDFYGVGRSGISRVAEFSGVFDGNGHMLLNWTARNASASVMTSGNAAFFGILSGSVTRLGFRNATVAVKLTNATGSGFAAVVAAALKGGSITNCIVDGARVSAGNTGDGANSAAGVFLASNNALNGRVENCIVTGDVALDAPNRYVFGLNAKNDTRSLFLTDCVVTDTLKSAVTDLVGRPAGSLVTLTRARYESAEAMLTAETYANFPDTVWKIQDGRVPELLPGGSRETQRLAPFDIRVLNTETAIDAEGRLTLTASYRSNGQAELVFRLEEAYAGVSYDAETRTLFVSREAAHGTVIRLYAEAGGVRGQAYELTVNNPAPTDITAEFSTGGDVVTVSGSDVTVEILNVSLIGAVVRDYEISVTDGQGGAPDWAALLENSVTVRRYAPAGATLRITVTSAVGGFSRDFDFTVQNTVPREIRFTDPQGAEIPIGASKQFSAEPSASVKTQTPAYYLSDAEGNRLDSKLTVSEDGTVTIPDDAALGTYYLTAEAEELKATYSFTVIHVPVTGIACTNGDTAKAGEEFTLTADIAPAGALQEFTAELITSATGVSLSGKTVTVAAYAPAGGSFTVKLTSAANPGVTCTKEFTVTNDTPRSIALTSPQGGALTMYPGNARDVTYAASASVWTDSPNFQALFEIEYFDGTGYTNTPIAGVTFENGRITVTDQAAAGGKFRVRVAADDGMGRVESAWLVVTVGAFTRYPAGSQAVYARLRGQAPGQEAYGEVWFAIQADSPVAAVRLPDGTLLAEGGEVTFFGADGAKEGGASNKFAFTAGYLAGLGCGVHRYVAVTENGTEISVAFKVGDVIIDSQNYTQYLTNGGAQTLATNAAAAVIGTSTVKRLEGYYILNADLNLAGQSFLGIGRASISTVGGFKGTFDGNGYAISDWTMRHETSGSVMTGGNSAFIGVLASGTVKNLGLINVSITARHASNNLFAGGLVGALAGGTISDCYINGLTIEVSGGAASGTGALFASTGNGTSTVKNCLVYGEISMTSPVRYAVGMASPSKGRIITVSGCFVTDTLSDRTFINSNSNLTVDTESGFCSAAELTQASRYAGFQEGVWRVAEGRIPELIPGCMV